MEEFKPKRKNNNYSGTDKAGAPRRAPRQNHQNKPPQENSTPANKPRRRPARPAAAETAQAPAQSVPAPRPRRPRNTPQGEGQAPHQQRRGRKPQQNNSAPHYEMTPAIPMHICPLGGLGEVGKNITLYECQGDMILVDCGLVFPDADMFGVDLVIPDFTYVLENKDRIKGLFITHGHEDHIGSLPYLLKKFNVPIYAARLTIGLIKNKLEEHGLASSAVFHEIRPRQKVKLGCFTVEPIHVNHSIPDALAFAIECPAGVVIHTGDFKVDYTPLSGDAVTDLSTIAEYGRKGVLALLSDSTNAERPGFTATEQTVAEGVRGLFGKAGKRRIIVATFASNIYRVQQIIDLAIESGRKVAVSGRSMVSNTEMARELGVPLENIFILANGDIFEISKGSARVTGFTNGDAVLIDGASVGEVDNSVLRERKLLSDDGVVAISLAVSKKTGEMMAQPVVSAMGFLYDSEHLKIEAACRQHVANAVSRIVASGKKVQEAVSSGQMQGQLRSFLYERTKRRPVVMINLIEVE